MFCIKCRLTTFRGTKGSVPDLDLVGSEFTVYGMPGRIRNIGLSPAPDPAFKTFVFLVYLYFKIFFDYMQLSLENVKGA